MLRPGGMFLFVEHVAAPGKLLKPSCIYAVARLIIIALIGNA